LTDHKDRMPSFLNLKDIERYGIPTAIDGIPMSLAQARIFVNMIGNAWNTEKFSLQESVEMSKPVFKAAFVEEDGKWVSRTMIRLSSGIEFKNKFYSERKADMARSKRKSKPATEHVSPMRTLLEGGSRNNKNDKAAIEEIIKLVLSQLSKEDKLSALKKAGYKVVED